jgi:hypothetical protein
MHLPLQVPCTVLAACCSLITTLQDKPWGPGTFAAVNASSFLIVTAAHDLPTTPTGNSRANKLSVMVKDQIEQSGLLPHLPGLLGKFTQALQACLATGNFSTSRHIAYQAGTMLVLLQALNTMLGVTACPCPHGATQPLAEPSLELALVSMQYISTALEQIGWQDWMDAWLYETCKAAFPAAASTTIGLAGNNRDGSRAGKGTAGEREPSGFASFLHAHTGGVNASCADLTVRWCCLMLLVGTLMPWVAKRTRYAAKGSSSSSSSGARVTAGSGGQDRSQTSTQQHWPAVAALADSLPTAYSNMASQLGYSRELVLLLTTVVAAKKPSAVDVSINAQSIINFPRECAC